MTAREKVALAGSRRFSSSIHDHGSIIRYMHVYDDSLSQRATSAWAIAHKPSRLRRKPVLLFARRMVDGQTKQKDTSQGSGFFTKAKVPFMMEPLETMSISKSCTCHWAFDDHCREWLELETPLQQISCDLKVGAKRSFFRDSDCRGWRLCCFDRKSLTRIIVIALHFVWKSLRL